MLRGPFAWGQGDVQRVSPLRPPVVSRRLEAELGGQGVDGDGGSLMCGLEVIAFASRVVGDDDVRRWYVIVECGAREPIGDACRCVPCFGCGVVGHEDVDGPLILGK